MEEKYFSLILLVPFTLMTLLTKMDLIFKLSPVALASLAVATATILSGIPENSGNLPGKAF